MEEKREKEREIERERSKHLDYVYVHAKPCCKRIVRHKHSARTLCAGTDFFRLSVCIARTNKVGARGHNYPKCAGV